MSVLMLKEGCQMQTLKAKKPLSFKIIENYKKAEKRICW